MLQVSYKDTSQRWNLISKTLKDFLYSDNALNKLEDISKANQLNEEQQFGLEMIFSYALYGFIALKDLYDEIRERLKLDGHAALSVYHDLNEKLFIGNIRKEIDDNFAKFKFHIAASAQVTEAPSKTISAQVVLKEGPEVINLKPESAVSETPIKLKVEGETKPAEPAPMPIGQVNVSPEPITVISSSSPKPSVVPIAPQQKPAIPSQPKTEAAGATEGPMIIHQKEESISVSQTQAASPFRQNSFGGYMGSFRSFSGQAPQAPVSSAKIEMPSEQRPVLNQAEQKIPVVVKKYEEEPVKTVHYSELTTPLAPKNEEKSQIPPPVMPKKQPPEGMIDLSNFTFRK